MIFVHIRRFAVHKGIAPNYIYMMSDEEIMQYKCIKHLYSAQSPYQQIDIYDTEEFGAILFLDYDTSKYTGGNYGYWVYQT